MLLFSCFLVWNWVQCRSIMTKNKGSQRRKIMKVALIASDNNASSGAFLSMTNLAIQLNQLHVKTIVIIPKEGPYVGPGDGVNLLRKHKIKYYVVPSISGVVSCDFPRNILATLGQIKYILRNKIYARGLAGILKKEHVDWCILTRCIAILAHMLPVR